jgi:hypothetical protein
MLRKVISHVKIRYLPIGHSPTRIISRSNADIKDFKCNPSVTGIVKAETKKNKNL